MSVSELDLAFDRLEARMAEFEARIVESTLLFWIVTEATVVLIGLTR